MLKIMTLAAVAAALAAPACAEEIRISTVGKASEQVRTEIRRAAVKVCHAELNGSAFANYQEPACIDSVVQDATAQLDQPSLIQPSLIKSASR